jgi:uncharacterized protein (TIGR02118 family)
MANQQVINIIETECQPEDAEKFSQWYNEVHIPMLLKSKGVTGVTRYQIAVEPGQLPRFMAVYKCASAKDLETFQKSPQTAAAVKDFNDTWGKKVKLVSRTMCNMIKDW